MPTDTDTDTDTDAATAAGLQERAVEFAAEHDLDGDPAYRLLDLASEVGELAADACATAEYGARREAFALSTDEVGDALFSLMLVADAADVEADEALATALRKYERRIESEGRAGSGEAGPD
jgi:NTP pyrophosphatase (non-canonical NTP hydrolase)